MLNSNVYFPVQEQTHSKSHDLVTQVLYMTAQYVCKHKYNTHTVSTASLPPMLDQQQTVK